MEDEQGVVWRERSAGIYRLSAYYFAVITSELPVQLFMGTLFITITHWMTNLTPTAWHFFCIWLLLIQLIFPAQVTTCC